MLKFIRKWIKVFVIKWVKGSCHHMCAFCKYRHECFEQMENE